MASVSFKRKLRTHCGLKSFRQAEPARERESALSALFTNVQPRPRCCPGQRPLTHTLRKGPCSPCLCVPLCRKWAQWYLSPHRTYPPQSGLLHSKCSINATLHNIPGSGHPIRDLFTSSRPDENLPFCLPHLCLLN